MRTITLIIVHCSATPEGQDFKLEDIDRWHRQRGWNGCGYHYVIELDGTIRKGRDESVVGAHCKGHNRHSIGVCYVGGVSKKTAMAASPSGSEALPTPKSKDTRTPAQKASLLALLTSLRQRYPHAIILGHHDLDPAKACPCFDAAREYGEK